MALTSPFAGIYRPGNNGAAAAYLEEQSSPSGRTHIGGYDVLKRDLRRLFEFIEPVPENAQTFSHRTFELLLRTCTEVESNCKRVFSANGQPLAKGDMLRYSDLESPMRLSEYEIGWVGVGLPAVRPFASFASSERTKRAPPWYRAYNAAKHDRGAAFQSATLETVMHATAGLYVLLYAQFGEFERSPLMLTSAAWRVGRDLVQLLRAPTRSDSETYQFEWVQLRKTPTPWLAHPLPERP